MKVIKNLKRILTKTEAAEDTNTWNTTGEGVAGALQAELYIRWENPYIDENINSRFTTFLEKQKDGDSIHIYYNNKCYIVNSSDYGNKVIVVDGQTNITSVKIMRIGRDGMVLPTVLQQFKDNLQTVAEKYISWKSRILESVDVPTEHKWWLYDGKIKYDVPIASVKDLIIETIEAFESNQNQPFTNPKKSTEALYDLLEDKPSDDLEKLSGWRFPNIITWLDAIKNQRSPRWRNVTGTHSHPDKNKPVSITFNAKPTVNGFRITGYQWNAAMWSWLYRTELIPSERHPGWYTAVKNTNNSSLSLNRWPEIITLQTFLESLNTALDRKNFKPVNN
jgi:hypothetical protein